MTVDLSIRKLFGSFNSASVAKRLVLGITNSMTASLFLAFLVLRLVLLLRCLTDVGALAPVTLLFGALQDLQVVFVFILLGKLFTFSLFRPLKKCPPNLLKFFRFSWSFVVWFFVIFASIVEFYFWSEFESRFNFIAVDYLVYTNEVIQNIVQSYPLVKILISTAVGATVLTLFVQPVINEWQRRFSYKKMYRYALVALLLLSFLPVLSPEIFSVRPSVKEVSSNGWKSLIDAFFNNELSYSRFYKTLPEDRVETLMRRPEFAGHIDTVVSSINKRERKLNVFLVVMESMSRKFMTFGGNTQKLTPYLDDLYEQGLSFSQVYATGTRTVRGLEAVDLAVPPTPGQSILRRPGFENLYSLGAILSDAGYMGRFVYGGYALFDNMGAFFEKNHMQVVDRTDLSTDEIHFENAWGVCDEDMFHIAVREADKIYESKKPFVQLIMTTSNHRPYTYPQNIDIPSGSSREGAVKYADYAVGQLIKEAQSKPWFKDTIFVFVADHNASVAGRTELPLRDFPIPFIIYGPSVVKKQRIDRLASQIDVAPTILDVLGLSYKNHFFGRSLLQNGEARAFVATYQSLGYYKNNILTVLEPKKRVLQFDLKGDEQVLKKQQDTSLVDEAISFYQYASSRFQKQLMKNTGDSQAAINR